MISKNMEEALNKQIAMEGYASYLYLSMSAWSDKNGLHGCAAFMRRQSDEERMHMLRIFDYISDVDGFAETPAIGQPPLEFENVAKMFDLVYEHEQKVTRSIYNLMEIATRENDFSSQNFLQWYITEQREEEALMRNILEKITLIGSGPMSLYYIDKEVQNINTAQGKADPEA